MLSFYLPEDRRQALLEGRQLPERTTGSVLLADLSGFTRLTEKLVERYGERRGPEELLVHLNRVYDALVEPLHARGGSVVYFSGDSITCFLDGDDGTNAAHVALAMQAVMRQVVERSENDLLFGIGVKVAFGAGEVRRGEVGDSGIQLLEALSGRVVDDVAQCERLAKLGEVLVTDATRTKLGDALEYGEARKFETSVAAHVVVRANRAASETRLFELARELPLELARPRLLPQIAGRLLGAHSEFIAELRKTTALFVHFEGIDFEAEDGGRGALDTFVRGVQEIAIRYEGAVLSLTLGEKGSYLYLNFGALQVHPDDAERAIRAAEEILDLARRVPAIVSSRIGISTGRVRAGSYGSRDRRVYGALGDDVNLAARLMMLSPPFAITVSESACAEAKAKYSFELTGEVPVKGKSSPVSIYRPVRKTVDTSVPESDGKKALFGREKEKAALTAAAVAFGNGEARRIVLVGEAGIGKSQLLKHLLAELEERGIRFVVGAGDAVERTNPYHAISKVFRTLFRFDEAPPDVREKEAFFEARLDEAPLVRRRAPLLRAVLPFAWPDNEFTAGLEGEVRKTNTEELLLSILRRAFSERPTALVLEDAHWFDSASWEFLRRVATEIVPHFIAVSSRPHGDAPDSLLDEEEIGRFLGEEGTLLPLSSLGESDIAALLERRLAVRNIPGPVLRLVLEQGGGHPFYSEELAYSLRDAGLLLVENGSARLAPHADEGLLAYRPGNVEAVITSRFDRLPAEVQTTLKVASVAGRDFDSRGIIDALPTRQDVARDLLRLEELSFLERLEGNEYRFKHALTQKAVYETLLFSQRQALHGKFAAFIERENEGNIAPFHPLLGYHYECAGLATKAVAHLEKAGERALRANANREALGFFRKALELSPEASAVVRGHYQRCIGDAQELLGNLKESQRSSEEALRLLGMAQPTGMLSLIFRLYGQIFFRMFKSQLEDFGEPESEEHRDVLLEAARAHLRLTQVYYYSGQNYQMLYSGFCQLNLASRVGRTRELAQAYGIMSAVASTVPMLGLSRSWGSAGLEVAEALTDRSSIAFVKMRASMTSLGLAEFARARQELDDAKLIASDLGDFRMREMACGMTGALEEIRGRFAACESAWNEAWVSARDRGDVQSMGWGLLGVAVARLRMRSVHEAFPLIEEAMNVLSVSGSTTHQYQAHGLAAEGRAELGELDRALEHVDQADRVLGHQRPNTYYILSGYSGVAHALLAIWDADRSSRILAKRAEKAVNLLSTFGKVFPFAEARGALYRGLLEVRRGDLRAAERSYEKGLQRAVSRTTPYEEGLLRVELGRIGPKEARRDHLEKAIGLFDVHGVLHSKERARALLDAVE